MGIRDLTKISMMTAVMAVLGAIPPIPLPISPVPITAQSIAPMIIGGLLGAKRGFLAVLLFVFLVACSLPLLAGGRGGVGVLFGPSGGYIIGWMLVALSVGYVVSRMKKRTFFNVFCVNLLFGLGLLYICGAGYLAATTGVSIKETFGMTLAFVPGDVLKAILATFITLRVLRAVPAI